MGTCKLSEIFNVTYGNSLEFVYLEKDDGGVNFVSRTAKNNGVCGKVRKISGCEPFPGGLLTVAVGGSVLETFLQQSLFYTGYHVMVLSPKVVLSTEQKLFYCQCIRANKYKYSYGRQANSTLPDLQIPDLDSIPDFVKSSSIQNYGENLLGQMNFDCDKSEYPHANEKVRLDSLFEIENGLASSEVIRKKNKDSENWIPYIRPSYRQATSIDAYVNKTAVDDLKVFPAGTLYVSTDGQGSHSFSYVSTFEFVPNSNVAVLIPKREMSLQEKLFYANCITNNRYKFSYGRKPKGERLASVLLPKYPPKYVTNYTFDIAIDGFSRALDKM